MFKKVLYLDFDSTMANSEKAICSIYNDKYKDYEGFEEADWTKVKHWAFKYTCKLIHEMYDEPHKVITDMFGMDEFFENLEFYDDVEDILPRLCKKYEVVICTCASPANASKKVLWIEEHLPYVSEVIILIKNGNEGVGKGRVHMIEHDSIFIDDHPSNLRSTKAENKYLYKYKETEFNQGWDGEVVSSWKEIENLLLREGE